MEDRQTARNHARLHSCPKTLVCLHPFVERILTVVQTLRLQKRSLLNFLVESVSDHRQEIPAPELIVPAQN